MSPAQWKFVGVQLSALSLVVISLLSPAVTFAQTTTTNPAAQAEQVATDLGQKLTNSNYGAPQNSDYAVMNLMHAALCQIAGMSPGGQCLANVNNGDGTTTVLAFNRVPGGGAVGGLSNVLASLYNPPTSTTEYLADVGKNLGIVQPAYAQNVIESSGGRVLRPVLELWRFSQRLAYIAFVIVFLAAGFMIMFRRRINPQTVISVQSALPGLVVGLIMVTFSYFIAALIVDLSFVGVQVVAGIFAEQPNVFGGTTTNNFNENRDLNRETLQDLANNSNIFHFLPLAGEQTDDTFGAINEGIGAINERTSNGSVGVANVIFAVMGAVVGAIIGFFAGPVGAAVGGAVGAGIGAVAGGWIFSMIIPLIILVALLIQLFRIFFALLSAYIQILVATIFGPFFILVSSVPGQGKRLTDWMKGLLANSMIFPAVFAVFLFAGAMLGLTNPEMWRNPPPLFGGLPTDLIRVLIAFGALLAAPSVPDMVKNAFGIKDQDSVGKAALGGFLAGVGAARVSFPGLGRSFVHGTYNMVNGAETGWRANLANAIERRYAGAKWFRPRNIRAQGEGGETKKS